MFLNYKGKGQATVLAHRCQLNVQKCKLMQVFLFIGTWTKPTTNHHPMWKKSRKKIAFVLFSAPIHTEVCDRRSNKKRLHIRNFWAMWFSIVANTLTFTWILWFATNLAFFSPLLPTTLAFHHSHYAHLSHRRIWKFTLHIVIIDGPSTITFIHSAFRFK